MIETRVDEMLSLIREGQILGESAFEHASLVDALQLRETDDSYRYYYDNEIYQRWRILPIHPDIRGVFEELHELTHTKVHEQTRKYTAADDETTYLTLTDRITQEIDYIAMSRGAQYYTDWYDALWASYLRNEIPMLRAEHFVASATEDNGVK